MKEIRPMTNSMGAIIRELLKARGLKAFELGEQIGMSPTSISKIMNDVSRPRQNTFSKMCQVLCETKEDERLLVQAFTGSELLEEEDPSPYNSKLPSIHDKDREILRMRAEQFLERKTQSIQFKRSVARELGKAGIAYQQDYCEGPYSTDFLIEKDGERIALECKANVGRDLEKTIAMTELLKECLRCGRVLIVVPYYEEGMSIDFVCVSDIASILL
jgi:transcriptional regulator with XRE-family HTH domain